MQNKFSDAVDCFQNALESDSNNPEVHNNLANTLLVQDKFDEAMRHYLQALQFRPNYTSALVGAAYILSEHTDKSKRDVDQAVKFAEHAAKLTGRKDGSVLKTLAAAYAAAGQFDKAEAAAVEAISLLTSAGDDKQADFVRQKLQTYRQGRQGNR